MNKQDLIRHGVAASVAASAIAAIKKLDNGESISQFEQSFITMVRPALAKIQAEQEG